MIDKRRQEIKEYLEEVIAQSSPLGHSLWLVLIESHPADISSLLQDLEKDESYSLFAALPPRIRKTTFKELSDPLKVFMLQQMSDQEKVDLLHGLTSDELADVFDLLSDEELKRYLNLLHTNMRQKVVSLLQFPPESAGGIMTTDVITLMEDFTVEQSVKLLQRLQPRRDIHQQLFVTDAKNILMGHINLEDLVLHGRQEHIKSFVKKNELITRPDEDRETIAQQMVHYGLMIVPVADESNYFLGVIPSETLVDVLVEEATEDVTRMASLPAMKFPYFEMSFLRLYYQRSYVLIALLIAESFGGTLLRMHESIMKIGILFSFIPMLTSAGGNTGSQSSAVVIQGLASGEMGFFNLFRLLRREFIVSIAVATTMGIISFIRSFFVGGSTVESIAVGSSITLIVFISAMLGTITPFILRRFNIDPAFSAGPLLATLMDILGVVIYIQVIKFIVVSL